MEQEPSYRKQIARQLRIQYVEGIYDNPVTLKSSLTVTQGTTTSPATSEIDCTGCPFSSAWSTRFVCWFSSVFTRRHQSTLEWWATQFLLPLAEVISDLQHAAIWRYLEHERRLTDKVFPSLVRHCGTRCRALFVTHLWQWRGSAHSWRLFYFAEHIILSIAPWQFRL